jgi:hypothetical protein
MSYLTLVQTSNPKDPLQSTRSQQWFKSRSTSIVSRTTVSTPVVGSMQFFNYMPKHKDTLPYYDTFPLVIVVDILDDGFTGLNMHYLPPLERAKLMDALYQITDTGKDVLSLSYRLLKSTSRLRSFRPCYKRYLNKYIRSNTMTIQRDDWNAVLFLPLARFEKASVSVVHADSLKKINNV